MFVLRRALSTVRQNAVLVNSYLGPIKFSRSYNTSTKLFTTGNSSDIMDATRIVSYEDMLKVIHAPAKTIIDVRNQDEVDTTGMIPSSIHIPLNNIKDTLASMSDEDFRKRYNREKPSSSDEIIFYCKSGNRATKALDQALQLGYSNSKNYVGSWTEWSSKCKE